MNPKCVKNTFLCQRWHKEPEARRKTVSALCGINHLLQSAPKAKGKVKVCNVQQRWAVGVSP